MSDTSTALAVRRPTTLASGYNPPPDKVEMASIIDLANYLAKAPGFVPEHFVGQPYKILAAMLYGRDLGITPTNALQHILVIDGKATADAQLMGMLVRRAGHRLEDKTTAEASTVTITRGDDGSVHTFTFTMQDASRAGLVRQGSAWQKYPQAMLFARALTGCARKGAQDALMGVAYTPEELGAEVQVVDGEAVVVVAPGVSEATAVSPPPATVIQPTPPAPPVEVQSVTAHGAESPALASEPAPPQAAQRRPGRSIGPQPKRTNVVTVAQGPETPATASQAPGDAEPHPDPVSGPGAPPALTDEPELLAAPEPVDPGKEMFLRDMRADLRIQTAKLFRVNALIANAMADAGVVGNNGKVPERSNVLPATPSDASDKALAGRIEADYPGRTLATLGEAELTALMEKFESNLARKREVLKERGISEE